MSLREDIVNSQKEALKSHDSDRLSILRMAFAAIRNEEIEKQHPLSDEEVHSVLARQVKQLSDAMADFVKGARQDLIDKSEKEIEILSSYLPKPLTDEEMKAKVNSILTALEPKERLNVGQAMGAVMKELKGVADGNKVRELVSEYLK